MVVLSLSLSNGSDLSFLCSVWVCVFKCVNLPDASTDRPIALRLENGNVIVDLGAMLLRHTLGDPHDVAALLLLQLQIRVEHAKVELLDEREHVQLDLVGDANSE